MNYFLSRLAAHPSEGRKRASLWVAKEIVAKDGGRQTDKITSGAKTAKIIRGWANHFIATSVIHPKRTGWHPKTFSLINHEDVREQCLSYLRCNKETKEGVKSSLFRKHVNEQILPELIGIGGGLRNNISSRTSTRWLLHLGLVFKTRSSGVFFDGHERSDVVAYRDKFLLKDAEFARLFPLYDGDEMSEVTMPYLQEGECVHRPVTQDECTCHANDDQKKTWLFKKQNGNHRKDNGTSGSTRTHTRTHTRYHAVHANARDHMCVHACRTFQHTRPNMYRCLYAH